MRVYFNAFHINAIEERELSGFPGVDYSERHATPHPSALHADVFAHGILDERKEKGSKRVACSGGLQESNGGPIFRIGAQMVLRVAR